MAVLVRELEDKERRAAMDKLGVGIYNCRSVPLFSFFSIQRCGPNGPSLFATTIGSVGHFWADH